MFLAVAPQAKAAQPKELKFGWPENGKVKITHTTFKKGREMRVAYELQMSKVDTGIEVTMTSIKLLGFEGANLANPKVNEKLQAMITPGLSIPRFRVSNEGQLLEVLDIDLYLKNVAAAQAADPTATQEQQERTQAILNSSLVRQGMEERVAGYWSAWVGAWVEMPVKLDEVIEMQMEEEIFEHPVPMSVRVEQLNDRRAAAKGLVKYRMTTEADAKAIFKAAATMFKGMAERAGKSADIDSISISNAEKRATTEVITDPKTMKPVEVVIDSYTAFEMPGEKPSEAVTMDHFEFEW